MKQVFPLLLILFVSGLLSAQPMQVKHFNFTTFRTDQKATPALLDKNSSPEAKRHPEYGILPFNSQCSECVELIDKRTLDSRLFIDPKDQGHTYSQQSYFPLHYKKTESDIWHTIDQRLRPDAINKDIYVANNQPYPTTLDLNKKITSLNTGDFTFEFNKNLSMYFFDDDNAYTQIQTGDYSLKTVGEEGVLVKNMWTGIDMEQVFRAGEIETNYVINAPLQIPISKGYLAIEDHFTLPTGYTFEQSHTGEQTKIGNEVYYKGDYILKNDKGEKLITYQMPVYVDAKAFGMHGSYKLIQNGNDYTLRLAVPVSWLNDKDNTYPLTIDPQVGITKIGSFTSSGGVYASLGFTSMNLGACSYHMNVTLPGGTTLTNAYADLEYKLTYNNLCGTPPLPAPYCTFSQATMEITCDSCHTTSGELACRPASPPYTGTCTSDSNLAPSAHPLNITGYVPDFLGCYKTQCLPYVIPFSLNDRDSICGDQCGYLCATGHIWEMTIEAQTINYGSITPDSVSVCNGNPVTFTVNVDSLVPPPSYEWTWFDDIARDTVTTSNTLTITPHYSTQLKCGFNDVQCQGKGVAFVGAKILTTADVATISVHGDTLISSVDSGNQWYRNDSLILGAINRAYIAITPGYYTLKYTPTLNCSSAFSDSVNLSCRAAFSVFPDSSSTGVYYGFNQSIGNNLQYLWNFGDDSTSTAPYPSHSYAQPGQYTVCLTVNDNANPGCYSTYCDSSFYVFKKVGGLMSQLNILSSITSINDLSKQASFTIFPNPATSQLIIQVSNLQPQLIILYNATGQKISEQKFTSKLDISTLSSGIYFIELKTEEGKLLKKKFVKALE